MKRTLFGLLVAAGLAATAVLAADAAAAKPPLGLPPVSIPADNPQTPEKVALGDKLFEPSPRLPRRRRLRRPRAASGAASGAAPPRPRHSRERNVFLPEFCIRRPVLPTVLSLAIVLLGVISFDRLSVREYPKIDPPVVSVRNVYKGASAQVIESQVTQPLEDSISGIEGIRTIKSVSREEVSTFTIEFTLERDVDAAANDVRDRVARERGKLPPETDDSVVAKVEADAQDRRPRTAS